MTVFAGVELGGTKCVAVRGCGAKIEERVEIATRGPGETLPRLRALLMGWKPAAVGIASFGPIGLDLQAPDWGTILAETKPGWSGTDVVAALALPGVPLALETDVGAAALAEARLGAGGGARLLLYLTVGTGIGAGAALDGHVARGLLHPELGHLKLRRWPGDAFAGACALHGDCVEGLASGPALAARAGADLKTLSGDHPVWHDAAADLGQLVAAILLTWAPDMLVLGGGVVQGRAQLFGLIVGAAETALGSYPPNLVPARILRPAALQDAGAVGALLLAEEAAQG